MNGILVYFCKNFVYPFQKVCLPNLAEPATAKNLRLPNPQMATLLCVAPPTIGTWPSVTHGRRSSALRRNPSSVPTHRLNRRHRFLPPVTATSASSAGEASAVTSEELPSSLESVQVFDLTGKAVNISDLWRDRKAVLAFARHFGCVLCRKRADVLAMKKEVMDAAGVALVLIGPGSVEQAKTFSEQTKFPGEIYADPNHSSYDALNFVYGVSTTFTPSAGLKIIQSYMEGYRQDWGLSFEKDTRTKGGWQQGGLLVAGPGPSNISFIHKDKKAGDDPNMDDVLKACCS